MVSWRPWSAADEALLDRLWNIEGLTYDEIAERLERSRSAIVIRVTGRRWPNPRNTRRPWTAEDTDELERLWTVQGLSYGEIAASTGRTARSIIGHVYRLGWQKRNPRMAAIAHAHAHAPKPPRPKAVTRPSRPNPATRPPKGVAIPSPWARVWTERRPRECAYPVAPAGEATVSCCNPARGSPYCAAHQWVVYARPQG